MSHLCLRVFCMCVICESTFAIDFLLIRTGFYFFTTRVYSSKFVYISRCPLEWKLSWGNPSIWFSLFFSFTFVLFMAICRFWCVVMTICRFPYNFFLEILEIGSFYLINERIQHRYGQILWNPTNGALQRLVK